MRKIELPCVFDADFFWYLTLPEADPLRAKIIEKAQNCIFTPNKVEFQRLYEYFFKTKPSVSSKIISEESVCELNPKENKELIDLCNKLNNVTIIQKVFSIKKP